MKQIIIDDIRKLIAAEQAKLDFYIESRSAVKQKLVSSDKDKAANLILWESLVASEMASRAAIYAFELVINRYSGW